MPLVWCATASILSAPLQFPRTKSRAVLLRTIRFPGLPSEDLSASTPYVSHLRFLRHPQLTSAAPYLLSLLVCETLTFYFFHALGAVNIV